MWEKSIGAFYFFRHSFCNRHFEDSFNQIRQRYVDASSGRINLVALLYNNGLKNADAAAQSGYYRIQGIRDPEGLLSAPAYWDFVDTSTGIPYQKTSGFGPTGWMTLS